RRTDGPSISSNMPLSAMIPSARSLSRLGGCSAETAAVISSAAIERLLERGFADAAERGNERLVRRLAADEVGVDQPLDRVRYLFGGKTAPRASPDPGL